MKFLDGKKFTETLIPGDKIRPKEGTKTYSKFLSKLFKDPVATTTIIAMHPDGFDTYEGPYGMQEHSDDWELVKAVVDIKAKHTPGPWRHGDFFDCAHWYARSECGVFAPSWEVGPLTTVYRENLSKEKRGEGEANARLIAAAPDLLHAVKSLLEYPAAIDGNPLYNGVVERVRAQAAQAIAKAEGNS